MKSVRKNTLLGSLGLLIMLGLGQCKSDTTVSYDNLTEEERRLPQHAVAGIEVQDPNLTLTLFAAEPQMSNPTNMDVDDKGRVWICEAYNYRNELNPRNPYKKAGDRILILEDTNQDGRADTSKVFYQGEDINAALGITVLGNQVIVSCSPNVWVFTDENGDDKADKKELLFQGIGGVQHDHGMHAFTFGPDGKLYFNYGNEGKGLHDKQGKPFVDDVGRRISGEGKPYREGMVFRSNLDGSGVEILGWNFRNPYEVAVDSYGNMWQSDNDDDGNRSTRINYVMDYGNYGYKDEMTGDDWRIRRTNLEDSVYQQHWHLNDPGVIPNLLQTYAGSPTGMVVYEGTLLPPKYQHQLIHADAGPNVVRAYTKRPDRAGFTASTLPILDASKRDKWFRPSDVAVAPDGSVFVADWYDPGVGGHAMGDTLRGRIFRLMPKGKADSYKIAPYNYNTPEAAVEALKNPNQAVRYKAFMALKAFGAKAEKALLGLWNGSENHLKARALWLLGTISGREMHYLQLAAEHSNEDIRAMAVRLARQSTLDVTPIYNKLAADASPQVRREVALAIRHKNYPQIWQQLANQHDGSDRWYLEALGIAADGQWDAYLAGWLPTATKETAAYEDIIWRSRAKQTATLLGEIIKKKEGKNSLRLYRAFDFQPNEVKDKVLLDLVKSLPQTELQVLAFKHFSPAIRSNNLFKQILPKVVSSIKNPADFLDIVRRYEVKGQEAKLEELLYADKNQKISYEAADVLVQLNGLQSFKKAIASPDSNRVKAAIEKFGSIDNELVTSYLIKLFSDEKLPIAYRKAAMLAMNGWNSEETLWKLAQADKIPAAVMPEAKQLLFGTWHADIRNAAIKLYGETTNTNTLPMPELLKLTGDATKGKQAFTTYCSSCHMVGNEGINFGPALSQIGKKMTKEGLYNAILRPSEGISFGYEGVSLTLTDGSEVQGILASKTESVYVLKFPGSTTTTTYDRKQVKQLKQLSSSLMPALPLPQQELVDLVTYLNQLR